MAIIKVTFPSDGPPGKILKWRVRLDTMVAAGRILLLYQNATQTGIENEGIKESERKLRATNFGRVKQILAKEGDIIEPGEEIALLEGCTHPTVMIDLCAECGADLRAQEIGKDGNIIGISQASVPMVHSIPELKVCPELAEKIGKEDEQRLLKDRKLVLLVDLDQTIVHTTNDNIPPNLKDVYHFQLYGPNSPWYHTRFRPNTRHFLSEMSRLYELHICTFGARIYAHTVASLLDKDGILFSHRILSRDECFDPASKTANLKALFPCGDDLVCIIDDREDVWQGCGNLVQVKPYHFFRHTGDINAPPGLEKSDVSHSSEFANINESSVNDSQNKGNKDEVSASLSEVRQLSNNFSVKEIDYEEEKDKESEDKIKETKNEDTKVNIEEDADFNVQSNIVRESKITTKMIAVKTIKNNKQVALKQESDIIDEDDDDYLLYLEDILRRIHTEFYTILDQGNDRKSLRDIIPRVRSQVLKGLCLTFSGLIPTHQKLHQTRAYKVARAFGAEVTQDLTEKTTHLVAIRKGTAKANAAKKDTNIKIVNPEWLWTCAERWEHVDERLFPLTSQARGSRVPPPHCSSPERIEDLENDNTNSFASSINPLMSFTQEEIEFMDKEVNEDMEEQDIAFESADDTEEYGRKIRYRSSDSDDSINGELNVSKRKKRKIYNGNSHQSFSHDKNEKCNSDDDDDNDAVAADDDDDNDDDDDDDDDNDNYDDDDEDDDEDDDDDDNDNDNDDDPVTCFRRGQDLPSDLDLCDNSQDSIDDLEGDNEDDREWNALGAALEREFLSE